MRLEIADTLPVSPRDLAKIGLERRRKLMGQQTAPQFPKPARLNPPRPIEITEELPFNSGCMSWTFGQYQLVAVRRVKFDDSRITIHRIARLVAEFFGLTLNDLQSATRKKDLVYARHIAIYLARQLTPKSLPAIARALGGRDHTTILYAYEKVKRLRATDRQVRSDIETLRVMLEDA